MLLLWKCICFRCIILCCACLSQQPFRQQTNVTLLRSRRVSLPESKAGLPFKQTPFLVGVPTDDRFFFSFLLFDYFNFLVDFRFFKLIYSFFLVLFNNSHFSRICFLHWKTVSILLKTKKFLTSCWLNCFAHIFFAQKPSELQLFLEFYLLQT